MRFNYLARKIVITGSYGDILIEEEGVFETYDKAMVFIKAITDSDEYEESILIRCEIVEYALNQMTDYENRKVWHFDSIGRKIDSEIIPVDTNAYFSEGDLVYIKPFPWNKYTHYQKEIIGVVELSPKQSILNDSKSSSLDEGDEYIVQFIDDEGCLDHDHFDEKAMSMYLGDLPDDLYFLSVLSAHYSGKRKIDEKLLKYISSKQVYVKKIEFLTLSTKKYEIKRNY